MQPTRWDLILDSKPVPVLEHLLEEVSRLFAQDLSAWPPQVQAFDEATGRQAAAVVLATPERPELVCYREAFKLARFDLARDTDATDDYYRNQRFLDAGLALSHKGLLLFLSRFITEQLLALGEFTQGRINRPRMLDVLTRSERHLLTLWTPS